MKNKIFITGGAGYVGTSLIPLLLEKGLELTIYDSLMFNNGDKLLPYITNPNFNFIEGVEDGPQKLFKLNGAIKANYIVVNEERYGLIGLKKCYSVTSDKNEIQ